MPRWRLVLKGTPVFRPSRSGQPTPDLHLASRYEKESRKSTIAATATATAAAKVVRIARRRRPRPAPLGLGTLFVVVWWGMDEWGGCTSDAPQPSVRLPPFPQQHDARTQARTHARFARFDSHMLLPTQRFWAGWACVSRAWFVSWAGMTVQLTRCELASSSFQLLRAYAVFYHSIRARPRRRRKLWSFLDLGGGGRG